MSQIDIKGLGTKLAAALQQQPSVAAAAGVPPIPKVMPPAPTPAPGVPKPPGAPAGGAMPAAGAPAPAQVAPSPHAQAAAQAIQQPTAADMLTPQVAQQTYGGKGLVPSENVVGNQIAQKVAEERLQQVIREMTNRTIFTAIRPLLFQ